jgi:hypothetical protein
MKIYLKSESEYSDIEFHRTTDNILSIEITTEFGSAVYYLDSDEVNELVEFIKLTNEQYERV